jgi:ERCC4-type nuclease
MMNILCDTREREIIHRVPNISTRTLPVGDIWIGLSGEEVCAGGIVAERKTIADFEASILDGRYREQRVRLLTYCQQQNARPLYILEGSLDRISGRLSDAVLQKYLNRLQLRYSVAVMRTDSIDATIALMTMLSEQLVKDPSVFMVEDGAQKSYTHSVSIVKRANKDDPKVFASILLQQCPGLSAGIADAILDACGGTFTGVFQAEEASIATIKVSEKRKVGPVLAKRLVSLLHAS